MIKINLVPQEILDREVQRQRMIQVSVAGAFVAVVVALVSMFHYQAKSGLLESLEVEQAKLKKLQAIVDQVNAFESRAAAVRARLAVMTDLVKSRDLYPVFMTDLIESLPDGVWSDSFGTSGDAKKGLTFNLPSHAVSTRDVTNWLRSIEASSLFNDAKISGISIAQDGEHRFSMSLHYTPGNRDKKTAAK